MYYNKYLKYKNKYLMKKRGGAPLEIVDNVFNPFKFRYMVDEIIKLPIHNTQIIVDKEIDEDDISKICNLHEKYMDDELFIFDTLEIFKSWIENKNCSTIKKILINFKVTIKSETMDQRN